MKNYKKQPLSVRLLISIGLLMAVMPLLFKEYIPMPDFARGAIEGTGLGLEISGIVLMSRQRKCGMDNVEEDTLVGK
jgi:hypothetical protein